MSEMMYRFSNGNLIALYIMTGVFLCLILAIAMLTVYLCLRHRRTQALIALKQSMIERGMTVDEVLTVLEAGSAAADRHHVSIS